MAKAGEGNWEMIVDTTTMEQKVLRQLKRAMQPALTDLEVDWGKLAVTETAPFRFDIQLFSTSHFSTGSLLYLLEADW